MDYFGDESGHLKSLLTGDCEVWTVVVIAGDKVAASRCAKKTVRNVTNVDEAKWNDLTDIQKRRFIDCVSDLDSLEFAHATIERADLNSLQYSHLLYQDVCFPPDWDLTLLGYVYGEALFEFNAPNDHLPPNFRFDRIASQKQSDAVVDHVLTFVPEIPEQNIQHASSKQVSGIQAADCAAGAFAEDIKNGSNWMSEFPDNRLTEVKYAALTQLEHRLHEYDTGP